MADLAQSLGQILPYLKVALDKIAPILAQPVVRLPYIMPTSRSQVIGAGLTNQPLNAQDFSHALEWPFEVHHVKFTQDASHTFRDWRFFIRDQIVSQDLMKASSMVAALVEDNTGMWHLPYPWTVRAKGGGLQPFVDNLDPVNPILVDIAFIGYLLIPPK